MAGKKKLTLFYSVLLSVISLLPFGDAKVFAASDPIIDLRFRSGKSLTIAVDEVKQLEIIAIYQSGIRKAYQGKVEWIAKTASGESGGLITDLEEDGRLIGKKEGRVFIYAMLDSISMMKKMEVEVKKLPRTVYLKSPRHWATPHIWYWYLVGNADASGVDDDGKPLRSVQPKELGAWPGPVMLPVDGKPGWYRYDIPRHDDEKIFAGHRLAAQPARLLFNNGGRGEQTKDFLRDGGCFYAEHSATADAIRNIAIVEGIWRSGSNCSEMAPNPFAVWARSSGGPFWGDGVEVTYGASGYNIISRNYRVFDDRNRIVATGQFSEGENRMILGEEARRGESVTLCLTARQNNTELAEECFTYTKSLLPSIDRLGAVYSEAFTTFSIWSPDHQDVKLWLDGKTIPMGYLGDRIEGFTDIYSVTVPGNYHKKWYHFIINGKTVRDPYAVMAEPGTDYNVVIDLATTEPKEGWLPPPELEERVDAILYEVSVRDFTIHPSSGVNPQLKGTFLGMVEGGTRLFIDGAVERNIKTGIDHLKELGITHVQLLPIFDYGTCSVKDPSNRPGCYNWGYDPENFNVPEERYSSVGGSDYVGRIAELKTMINEFHKAGIRVIIDVVYNHTWTRGWRDQDEGEQYFSDITNRYFTRNGDRIIDLTGTGNSIDPSDPMVSRYIRDSLEYWVTEYRIDGFRFDLLGVFKYDEAREWAGYLNAKYPDRKLLFYGEPWAARSDPEQHSRVSLDKLVRMQFDSQGRQTHFGGFNDVFRNAIKGPSDNGLPGYAFNYTADLGIVSNGIRGSILRWDKNTEANYSVFAEDPEQTINYVSVHDNLTLWDKINRWAQGINVAEDYKRRIHMFSHGIIMTSQGIPFIHSGAEMLRTKYGNPNSYRHPDSINKIDWNWKRDNFEVFTYFKNLVHMRKAHPGLRLNTGDEIRNNVLEASRDKNIGFLVIKIRPTPKTKEEMIVIYNSGRSTDYLHPTGVWKVGMQNGKVIPIGDEPSVSGTIRADGSSVTMLYQNRSHNIIGSFY